jgi:hypothetical protein
VKVDELRFWEFSMKVGDLVRAKDDPQWVGIVVSFPEEGGRLYHRRAAGRPCVEIYYLDGETMIQVIDPFDPVWEVISEGR